MTTYNTGNPVPSADARDRYDNSQTLDEVVNGDSASYETRTGKQVISLGGMNYRFNNAQEARESAFNLSQEEKQEEFQSFLDGSGWSSLGAYGAGVVITSHTQTIDYQGQPYQLKPSIPASLDAPYIATGAWATEGDNFKLVGDNSLRQDLLLNGSTLNGYARSVLDKAITTVGDALDTTPVSMWEPTFVNTVTDRPDPLKPEEWDWAPAFSALATFSAIVGRIEVRVPKEITIKSPVTVDVNRIMLVGPGRINGKLGVAGQHAVTFTSGTALSYFHTIEAVRNLEIFGDNICHGTRYIGAPDNSGTVSHLLFNSMNVANFKDGYSFFNNAYILTFLNCDGWNCDRVFYMPPGSVNAGERLTFIGGTYYNSNILVSAGSGEWYFTNCSFDFSKKLVYARGAVTFTDCHGEFLTGEGHDSVIEIEYTNTEKSTVSIRGGEWLNLATLSPNLVKFVNTTNRLAARCIIKDASLYGVRPSSGYWATGQGRLTTSGISSTSWTARIAPFTKVENNLLSDGGFEEASTTPVDAFYVSADTGGMTSRFKSANIEVSTSSAYAASGTKSMLIRKTGGVLSNATVSLLVPVKEKNVGFRFKLNKPVAGAGTLYIETYWAIASGLYGVASPVVNKTLFASSIANYVFTGATPGWVDYKDFTGFEDAFGEIKYDRTAKERPDWANCLQIRIVLRAMNGSVTPQDLYFDTFEVFEL